MFVDSDHAEDKVFCRSRSGFLMYVNTAFVQWFSKNQSTVETSVFSAEFVFMKQSMDALRGLRKKAEDDGYSHIWSIIYLWG